MSGAIVGGVVAAAGSVAAGSMSKAAAKSAQKSSEKSAQAQAAMSSYYTGQGVNTLAAAGNRRRSGEVESSLIQNALGTGQAGIDKIKYLAPYGMTHDAVDYMQQYSGGSFQTTPGVDPKDRRRPGEVMAYQLAQTDVTNKTRNVNNAYAEALRLGNLAYEAKLAGNTELEAQYKAQADAAVAGGEASYDAFARLTGGKYGSRDVNLSDQRPNDMYGRVGELLASPMGGTVDQIVAHGNRLAGGPGTPGYEADKQELMGPYNSAATTALHQGTNAIAAGQRKAEGDIRDMAGARGSARSLFAERDASTNLTMAAAQNRSELILGVQQNLAQAQGAVNKYMYEAAPIFAASSVDIGRNFANGSPGIRESVQGALDSLAVATAGLYASSARSSSELQGLYANQGFQAGSAAATAGAGMVGGATGALSAGLTGYAKTQSDQKIAQMYIDGFGKQSGGGTAGSTYIPSPASPNPYAFTTGFVGF